MEERSGTGMSWRLAVGTIGWLIVLRRHFLSCFSYYYPFLFDFGMFLFFFSLDEKRWVMELGLVVFFLLLLFNNFKFFSFSSFREGERVGVDSEPDGLGLTILSLNWCN